MLKNFISKIYNNDSDTDSFVLKAYRRLRGEGPGEDQQKLGLGLGFESLDQGDEVQYEKKLREEIEELVLREQRLERERLAEIVEGSHDHDYDHDEVGGMSTEGYNGNYSHPVKPDAEDCPHYMRVGSCKYGSGCKFNHPRNRRNLYPKAAKDKEDYYSQKPMKVECKYYMTSGGCKHGKACRFSHSRAQTAVAPAVEFNFLGLPIRPGEVECSFYMRNGTCKNGSNCRFTHPAPTAVELDAPSGYVNDGTVSSQAAPQTTMSSWSSPKSVNGNVPVLPVVYSPTNGAPPPNLEWRSYQGETECSFYMRNGTCKNGSNCRFTHPAPTAVELDAPSGYVNGGTVSSQAAPQTTMSSWSSPKSVNGNVPVLPVVYSPNNGAPAPNLEWSSYQAPVYPATERRLPTPPASVLNNPTETNSYTHHKMPMLVDEFPERPGEPECNYFIKTGYCKHRSGCKFHHPKSRMPKSAPCALSDKGVPLRPVEKGNFSKDQIHSISKKDRKEMEKGNFSKDRIDSISKNDRKEMEKGDFSKDRIDTILKKDRKEMEKGNFSKDQMDSISKKDRKEMGKGNFSKDRIDSISKKDRKEVEKGNFSKDQIHSISKKDRKEVEKGNFSKDQIHSISKKDRKEVCMYYTRHGLCKYGPACRYEHPVQHDNSASTVSEQNRSPSFGSSWEANSGENGKNTSHVSEQAWV